MVQNQSSGSSDGSLTSDRYLHFLHELLQHCTQVPIKQYVNEDNSFLITGYGIIFFNNNTAQILFAWKYLHDLCHPNAMKKHVI